MTTEDDFQAALDANPDDWQTRLVFADWLQERNDPRADGYRALGTARKRAIFLSASLFRNRWILGTVATKGQSRTYGACMLADLWFRHVRCSDSNREWKYFPTRQAAEDAAALAFAEVAPAEGGQVPPA